MAIFDYMDVGSKASTALVADALAITLYSYHNLDNGFAVGYQKNGMGLGLPATLVKAVLGGTDSQGVVPGIPWNRTRKNSPAKPSKKPAGPPSVLISWGTLARSISAAPFW